MRFKWHLRASLSEGVCSYVIPTISFAEATENSTAFTGYSVGIGFGSNGQYINTIYNNDITATRTTATLGMTGLSEHLYANYNFALNSMWLIGINLNGQYNSVSELEHTSVATHRDALIQSQYGANTELGITPFAHNLFYVFVGPSWAQIKINYLRSSVNYAFSSSKKIGITAGMGASQNIHPHVNITEQFSYAGYKTQNDTLTDLGTFLTEPSDTTVMLGIEYHF